MEYLNSYKIFESNNYVWEDFLKFSKENNIDIRSNEMYNKSGKNIQP
jgi:hypothetical protein